MEGKICQLISEAKNQKVYEEAQRLFCQPTNQQRQSVKALNKKVEEIKSLAKKVGAWERQYKNLLNEEMKPLVIQAEATKFKRNDSIRNKIVTLHGDEILKEEDQIISEYCQFLSRPDFERIKQECPEVIELKKEPLILLELAWAKKGSESKPKLTPDEWRQKAINRMMVEAQDAIASKLGALKSEVMEKLELKELKREMEKLIDEKEDLTPEEKEEIKAGIDQSEQTLADKQTKRAELI